jgi:AAHS family 4-hydroxybenzoate transporter-like MFS transporter
MSSSSAQTIDIGRLLNERALSSLQYRLFVLCIAVGVLDGFDNQFIGTAASSMAAELSISLAKFGPIFSSAIVGAAIGSFAVGALADRLGRRRLLIGAVFVFGLFTLATAFVHSFRGLILMRLLAGFGLGGAPPCFLALAADYTPQRIRRSVTSLLWAGFPLGVAFGGVLSSAILRHFDWRTLFYVGGAIPIALLGFLIPYLPESVRFLFRRGSVSDRALIASIVRELDPALIVNDATRVVLEQTDTHEQASMKTLFRERTGPTLALWGTFLMTFATLATLALWAPPLLRQVGMDAPATALAIAGYGFGGTIGVAVAGRLVEHSGIVRALVPALVLGALSIAALEHLGNKPILVDLAMFLGGFGVSIGSSAAVSLASFIYPTAARSTGIGLGMGIGRIGQILGPLFIAVLVSAQWVPGHILSTLAFGPVTAAVFVLILSRYAIVKVGQD